MYQIFALVTNSGPNSVFVFGLVIRTNTNS